MANIPLLEKIAKLRDSGEPYKVVPMQQIQRTGGSQTQTDINPYWFSALRSITPTAPPSYRPRVWPFIPGWNQIFTPRQEEADGRVPFELLYRAADEWDLFSTAMETVIDKILSLDWQIRAKTENPTEEARAQQEADPIADSLTEQFQHPCRVAGMDTFRGFGNKILTDMYIGDCATIWLEKNVLNQIISLQPIDGSHIKVLLDDTGRRPANIDPVTGKKDAAFQQIMYGFPATDFTEDDIIYAVRKPRNKTPYGRSHLEQILTWANIGIRSQRFLLAYYESGNTPEMLIPVDASVSPQKVAEWNNMLDSVMSGVDNERRKVKMIPSLTNDGKMQAIFPKEPLLKTDLDEWLARIICFCLGLNPQAFIKSMNRASSEQAQDTAEAEGQQPVINWFEDVMNEIIRRLGYGDTHEFSFRVKREQDGLKQMQIDVGYLAKGVWCIDDVLRDLGMDTYDEPWSQMHMIDTPTGAIPVESVAEMAQANIDKLKTPPPAPQAPAGNGQNSPEKGQNPPQKSKKRDTSAEAKAVKKGLDQVIALVKAHHPEASHAAEQLEAKLNRKLKEVKTKVEEKIKSEEK